MFFNRAIDALKGRTNTMQETYFTAKEVAKVLNVTPATIRLWVNAGHLKGHKLGERSLRIHRADLEKFVQKSVVDAIGL